MFASSASGSMLDKALAVAVDENIYYYGSKTLKRQSIPTVQRTNFVQSLASVGGGQSVITISPDAGIGHIILGLKLKAPSGGLTYTGMALGKAWAYNAINQIQFRYGSSSLFQKSGQQLLIETIATAGSQFEANSLMSLAGSALYRPADYAGDQLFAYAVIPLPHCGAQSGVEAPNPFPTELLNAPIVITIDLKRPVDMFAISPQVASPTYPSGFDEAYLQVRQINPIDRGQLMNISPSVSYAFPTTFFQQENSVALNDTELDQEVVLTGFRSGSCKGIHCWLVDTANTANVNGFVLPRDLELSYAGNVIHKYKGVSSQILDTLYTDVPSYFNNSILTADASPATTWSISDTISAWTHFPLQQRFEQLSAEFTSVSGLGVANGVMNLRLKTPSAKNSWRLYYVPYYDVALMFNNGNCEYVF
jgi:hypothetical protein